jgi:hypothetical protein
MFAVVLKIVWDKTLKKLADLHLSQGNLQQSKNFHGSTKPLFSTKQGGGQLKKIIPFFKQASSSLPSSYNFSGENMLVYLLQLFMCAHKVFLKT